MSLGVTEAELDDLVQVPFTLMLMMGFSTGKWDQSIQGAFVVSIWPHKMEGELAPAVAKRYSSQLLRLIEELEDSPDPMRRFDVARGILMRYPTESSSFRASFLEAAATAGSKRFSHLPLEEAAPLRLRYQGVLRGCANRLGASRSEVDRAIDQLYGI